MVRQILTTAPLLLCLACASGSGQTGSSGSRNRDIITSEEIDASSAATVGDLIHQLRPNWLRGRGPISMTRASPDYPVIYVDGVRSSDPEILLRIVKGIVTEVRFLRGRDATTRFGLDHAGGAILITTRRGG